MERNVSDTSPSVQWRYLVRFAGIYVLLEAIYFALPDTFLRDVVYHDGVVVVSAAIIHWLQPQVWVFAEANRLQSSGVVLEIVRGCDGAGVAFLMIAAMFAFPASLHWKLFGAFAATLLVWTMNQARIVVLYFVVGYDKAWFAPIHGYIAPTLMVVVGGMFYILWLVLGQDRRRVPR